jgi:hypothetical protein
LRRKPEDDPSAPSNLITHVCYGYRFRDHLRPIHHLCLP